MTTSELNAPRYVADCSVGGPTDGVTVVPLTQTEIDQRAKDAIVFQAEQDAIAAEEAQKAIDRQAAINALRDWHFTDAMIAALIS